MTSHWIIGWVVLLISGVALADSSPTSFYDFQKTFEMAQPFKDVESMKASLVNSKWTCFENRNPENELYRFDEVHNKNYLRDFMLIEQQLTVLLSVTNSFLGISVTRDASFVILKTSKGISGVDFQHGVARPLEYLKSIDQNHMIVKRMWTQDHIYSYQSCQRSG